MTKDDPSRQQRLDILGNAVTSRIQITKNVIEVRKKQGFVAAAALIETGQSDEMTDRVRDDVLQVQDAEKTRLQECTETEERSARYAVGTLGIGFLAGFGMLVLVWLLLTRESKERKQSATDARLETQLLQLILGGIGDGVVVADENGRFLIFNDAAERILGIGATESQPKEWAKRYGVFLADTVTPCPPDQVPLTRAIRGESVDDAELFIRHAERPDGLWIEVNGRALHDAKGRLCGGVVVFRDISPQKKAQDVLADQADILERANAELTAANKELETFTYSVSHDLRAPLRHIHGYAKILEEDFAEKLDPDAKRYLQRIQDGVQQMGNLIEDLLNLTRVGRQALNFQITGFSSLVDDVITSLQHEMEGRNIVWKVGTLPFVECDPGLMRQVLLNLLSNAVKYTRPREEAVIEVGQTEVNGAATVFVRDNGVGFNMKYADKLFGVFQRLHRAEDFEGTGVGLATVQRIVRKHGGKIWAEAELDRGATFFFTLGGRPDRPLVRQTAGPSSKRMA